MEKTLKAVKITITYYGVGLTKEQASNNAWSEANNDILFLQKGSINETTCSVDETNFDPYYLASIKGE
jgi:hypothetical protein